MKKIFDAVDTLMMPFAIVALMVFLGVNLIIAMIMYYMSK